LFEAALCGAGLLLAAFTLASSHVDLNVLWLPASGGQQLPLILGLSIVGLICVALAMFGITRSLLFLFSGAVAYFLIRGLFLNSTYTFSGESEVHFALLVVLASILAFAGAFPIPRRRR
jgi:hypothetical protein